jgi:hypothetical protein
VLRSAEIRWFFPRPWSDEVRLWFSAGRELEPEGEREDQYLLFPDCETVGVKLREGKLEVKARVSGPSPISLENGVRGQTDQWVKWSFASQGLPALTQDLLQSGQWVGVQKKRIVRKFSADSDSVKEVPPKQQPFPASGCNVELTAIKVNATPKLWFSLGFEAFGPPAAVARILDEAVRSFFSGNGAMPGIRLSESESLNYPAWLRMLEPARGT